MSKLLGNLPLESASGFKLISRQMLLVLSKVPIFQGLTVEELALLEPLFEPYDCFQRTVIFEQGDPASYLYLVLNGAVEIRHKPYDGPHITVTHVTTGGVFGWSAAIGSAAYTSGALCVENCAALRIRGNDLRALCVQYPETGKLILDRLARVASTRWHDSGTQLRAILTAGATGERPLKIKMKGDKQMATTSPNHTTENQLKGLIEQISAYIEHFHGGSVEFVTFDGKVLKVRLGGACLGCPLSPATLHGWVAGTVHQFFPDVEVIAAE